MVEQFSVAVDHKAARVGDQSQRVTPFARTFPSCAGKWSMPREDQAEGEVARRHPRIDPVLNIKQEGEPSPPIGGRRGNMVRSKAKPARRSLKAGGGGKPGSGTLVIPDDEAIRALRQRGTKAEPQPRSTFGGNEIVLLLSDCVD